MALFRRRRPEAAGSGLEARPASVTSAHPERVVGWEVTGRGVRVWTPTGAFAADRLVLAAGAWTPALAASLALPIRIERRVQHFFTPTGDVAPEQHVAAHRPAQPFRRWP